MPDARHHRRTRSSSACPARSSPTSTASPSPPTASASSAGHGVDRAGRGRRRRRTPASPTTTTAGPAPRSWPPPAEVWERADLICKVKEPQASEFGYFRPDLVLFTYLHLAAYPDVADALLAARGHRHRLRDGRRPADGALPLLAPMSEVAGRMSVQVGAHFLERHNGGRGRAARRRARRPSGAGRRARRRQRRLERGLDGGRHRGRGRPARQERRPPPLHRPDPDGPHHHADLQPRARSSGSSPRPTW